MAASHNVPDVAHQASPRDKCGHNMGPFQIYDVARAAMSGPDSPGQKAEFFSRKKSMAHQTKRLVPSLLGSIQRTVFQACCIRANASMPFFLCGLKNRRGFGESCVDARHL